MEKIVLTAVIAEDESESLQLLEGLINSIEGIKVTGSTSNPDEAAGLIASLNPDLVFLDVKMPGKNGFEVLDELIKYESITPFIVFITAHDEFAVRAFEYAAFDYLLKPIDPERLSATISRCREYKKTHFVQNAGLLLDIHKKLIYRSSSGIVLINPADIVYIEADGNYSLFKLINGRTETITVQLGKIASQLPADKFFRISRTYIINLNFLQKINPHKRQCILLCNGTEFRCDISHDNIKILMNILKMEM